MRAKVAGTPDFSVGEVVIMRKTHPCGGRRWRILRTGADFRVKCLTCGHMLMLSRARFERAVSGISKEGADDEIND